MIYICAGHASDKGHNYDSGAVGKYQGKTITEAQLTEDLRDSIVTYINGYNATATDKVNLRTDKDDWNLSDTIKNANTTEKDIVFDIHFNSATPKATGVEVFYPTEHTQLEKMYANLVLNKICSVTGLLNRGIKTEDKCRHKRLGIMRPKGINLLVEICFITNENDMAIYFKHYNSIVEGIAKLLIQADNELK